ncbi:MAG: hypothetical protein ACPGU6_01820 [Tenacibaculum sp.]
MGMINFLQVIINILYYFLWSLVLSSILYFTVFYIYPDLIPESLLKTTKINFSFNNVTDSIGPILAYVNLSLLLYGFSLLKRIIPFFKRGEFYTFQVLNDLRIVGFIFVFIGLSIMLIKMVLGLLHYESIEGKENYRNIFSVIIRSFDVPMISIIISGLFFLVFSDSFKKVKKIKEENDLTI